MTWHLLTCPGWETSRELVRILELSRTYADFTQGPGAVSVTGRAFLLLGWG